jgi:hypothetical protein
MLISQAFHQGAYFDDLQAFQLLKQIWLFQQCGQEIHLLEYYENNGEALTHYLQYLKGKPYTYGKHLVPKMQQFMNIALDYQELR